MRKKDANEYPNLFAEFERCKWILKYIYKAHKRWYFVKFIWRQVRKTSIVWVEIVFDYDYILNKAKLRLYRHLWLANKYFVKNKQPISNNTGITCTSIDPFCFYLFSFTNVIFLIMTTGQKIWFWLKSNYWYFIMALNL